MTSAGGAVGDQPSPERAFVSRGGLKLAGALAAGGIDVAGSLAIDIGASTGGFTDCLLRSGAEQVIAVDVGYGQFAWSLRNDPRVTLFERQNARELQPGQLPYAPDLAVIDVSFISVTKILPALLDCMAPAHRILALVKPQFEVGRGRVGKGGVVRELPLRVDAMVAVAEAAQELGEQVRGILPAPISGPKGNLETFIWLERGAAAGERFRRSELEALATRAEAARGAPAQVPAGEALAAEQPPVCGGELAYEAGTVRAPAAAIDGVSAGEVANGS